MRENHESLNLDAALLCNMRIAMQFKDFQTQISGIDFSKDGTMLVVYDEEKLQTYDAINAKPLKTLFFKLQKISFLRFTHHNNAVVLLPQTPPYHLLYWSIFDNSIVKQFIGNETFFPTHLSLNPIKDLVLTTFSNNSLMIYNINSLSNQPVVKMDPGNQVKKLVASFDNTGLVLVVGAFYEQEGKPINKLEFHQIEIDGTKGKF